MAIIHAPTSPVARCSVCGVQRQFHTASDVPHSADRDHEFVAETIADFEPDDLDPGQLVAEIFTVTRSAARIEDCRSALLEQVRSRLGVDWDDLQEALS